MAPKMSANTSFGVGLDLWTESVVMVFCSQFWGLLEIDLFLGSPSRAAASARKRRSSASFGLSLSARATALSKHRAGFLLASLLPVGHRQEEQVVGGTAGCDRRPLEVFDRSFRNRRCGMRRRRGCSEKCHFSGRSATAFLARASPSFGSNQGSLGILDQCPCHVVVGQGVIGIEVQCDAGHRQSVATAGLVEIAAICWLTPMISTR